MPSFDAAESETESEEVRHRPARLIAQAPGDPAAAAALAALLTDPAYLVARLRADGGNSGPLEADYARAGAVLPPGAMQAAVAVCGAALRRESHALRLDPAAWYAQLYNRLWRGDGGPGDLALAAGPGAPPGPWLRAAHPLPAPHPALYRTLAGHSEPLHGVAISADGRWAVSASDDETVRVWDLAGGGPHAILRGHVGASRAVALAADGQRVVSAGEDGTLCVWDLEASGEPRLVWRLTVVRTYQGYRAAAFDAAGGLRAWSFRSGWPMPHPEPIRRVTARGSARGYPPDSILVSWRGAATPDAADTLPSDIEGHVFGVPMVALTSDGRWAVAGHDHDQLCIWDLVAGAPRVLLHGHEDWVQTAALTADGQRIISGGWDGTVRVWDLPAVPPPPDPLLPPRKAKRRARQRGPGTYGVPMRVLTGHSGHVNRVAVTADGSRAVSAGQDRTLRVWDLAGAAPPVVLADQVDARAALALTADGRRVLVSADEGLLRLVDLGQGGVGALLPHSGVTWALAITPDGRWAVSADHDAMARVWDLAVVPVAGDQPKRRLRALAVTPDGRWAAGTDDTRALWAWDPGADAQSPVAPPFPAEQRILALALAPAGRRVVAGSREGTIRVWDVGASAGPPTVLAGHSVAPALPFDARRATARLRDQPAVQALAITPDGRRAVSGGMDWTLRVWDLAAGPDTAPGVLADDSQAIWAVAITPDGRWVVSGGDGDGTVRIWDLDGAPARTVLAGHTGWVLAVALTADGRWAISGSQDRTVRVWDVAHGACAAVLTGHTAEVRAVGLSPDGRWAISGGADSTLRVWNLAHGTELARYTWDAPFESCTLGADGSVTARDGGGQILCFMLENAST